MKAAQWARTGNALEGIPSTIQRLLADADGKTFGYGYGEGAAMVFSHEHGQVSVLPTQWVVLHDDGTITVVDDVADTEVTPEHDPCCSSHGVPMSCARYRRTHFVDSRPCCGTDAKRLTDG